MTRYAVDYDETSGSGLRWESGGEPEEFAFNSFGAKKPQRGLHGEEEFLQTLQSGDEMCVLGTSVTETFCFLVEKRGVTVYRVFARDLKDLREDLGLEKKKSVQALYVALEQKPELLNIYVSIPPELYILRRWTRMHFRFQKRFRTGIETSLALLQKEIMKLAHFGHLDYSRDVRRVENAVSLILPMAEKLEDVFLDEVKESLNDQPLWSEILKEIKGIGPKIGSKIVASGPSRRFANRDHFVARAGLHVRDGKAARRKAGEILRRDPLLWDAALQFARNLHFHDSEWRDAYTVAKDIYIQKGLTKAHADRAARRRTVTHLFRRIWRYAKDVDW